MELRKRRKKEETINIKRIAASLSIRKARDKDCFFIVQELQDQIQKENFNNDIHSCFWYSLHIILNPKFKLFVLHLTEVVIGYICFDDSNAMCITIKCIEIFPSYRRMGYGTFFIKEFEKLILKDSSEIKEIQLISLADTEPFWKQLNYKVDSSKVLNNDTYTPFYKQMRSISVETTPSQANELTSVVPTLSVNQNNK